MAEDLGMNGNRLMTRAAGALALLALLAGCNGGSGSGVNAAPPLYAQIAQATRASIAKNRMHRAERPPLTRKMLDEIEGSYIEVTLERPDIFAYLSAALVRRDGTPGEVVQWRTEDEVTLTMRNGMLIATRGLGGDLVSADVAVAEGVTGPASGGEKVMYVRTGDLEERRLVLSCDLADLGPAPVEIVELTHPARHLRESCTAEGAAGGRVVNDYWVDSRSGIVWQSRQWAGPHIGYMRIRRLTTG